MNYKKYTAIFDLSWLNKKQIKEDYEEIRSMFSIKELILKKKLTRLNQIYCINSGGCAFAAYSIHKYIQENMKEESEILYLVRDEGTKRKLENNKAETCAHAVVKYRDFYIDSEGFFTETAIKRLIYYKSAVSVSEELVLESFDNSDWNWRFDREDGIPQIEEIFDMQGELIEYIR